MKPPFALEVLNTIGTDHGELPVVLSNELISLLSDQLYKSPAKAIEELVVNSYDANARMCRVYIPQYPNQAAVIFDDGIGMDEEGMKDLWHIGRSKKRSEEIEKRLGRKQIGKFGIGKLAARAIANKLTYISRTEAGVLSVGIDFRAFAEERYRSGQSILLPVRSFPDYRVLAAEEFYKANCKNTGVDPDAILRKDRKRPWTMAILEDFKEERIGIKLGVLRHVLKTAMPLESKFKVYLNKLEMKSSKLNFPRVVEFSVADLPEKSLERLQKLTKNVWLRIDNSLVSDDYFRDGIRGNVCVFDRSLEGKSSDIGRSNGFFVYVRKRLVNEQDPAFGVKIYRGGIFNRFYARVDVDGLDNSILISREEVDSSSAATIAFRALLSEIYKEAKSRHQEVVSERQRKDSFKKETERQFVDPSLVEHPIADVLSTQSRKGTVEDTKGEDIERTKFQYINIPSNVKLSDLASKVHSGEMRPYKYDSARLGDDHPIVIFDPMNGLFTINEDHAFALAHGDDPRARLVLEDLVTAEVMLEVHLRDADIDGVTVTDILQRRDELLRSLARNHPTSLNAVAKFLEDAAANERELEFSLVMAARALGFEACHISGDGEPDGIAKLKYYPRGEIKLTLEAKSSEDEPSLGAIDFSGLAEHVARHEANGCLLVAPRYPGRTRKDDSAASFRARQQKISCWTVGQLAKFCRMAEAKRLTAANVVDIVLECFSPDEVEVALDDLFGGFEWTPRELREAIVSAVIALEDRLSRSPRTVDMIAAEVSRFERFSGVERDDIIDALNEIAVISNRGLILKRNRIALNISTEELGRRVSPLLAGPFRQGEKFRVWRRT